MLNLELSAMKYLRFLLFPFGFLYGIITGVRNLLYDAGIFRSYKIPVKSICVGNLSVGGTGKTPHVAYLADLLKDRKVHILSRGYGRKTKGFILLDHTATSETVGDEPLLYYRNFPWAKVAVCESRQEGVEKLLAIEAPDVILLDDAFQHRAITAGMNILLTDYSHPYYRDLMLPAGNLREWASGKKRADLVIVTKSPAGLGEPARQKIVKRLGFAAEAVYFSSILYGDLVAFHGNVPPAFDKVLLVTGIANPSPLEKHLASQFDTELMPFPDHHAFTLEDIQKIHKKFDTFAGENKAIVTTEKDYMRLCDAGFSDETAKRPWFYQRITVETDRKNELETVIKDYVRAI